MNHKESNTRDHEWHGYYNQFSYFSADAVRDGCHPRIMEQDGGAEKAIVLVHGLTDSPHFLSAIGVYFYKELGYNVYMPLLHCHGLKKPKGMEEVALEQWKANVSFAVNTAASHSNQVSIGGLSTGGTLSFYTAVNSEKVNGALYLFSAALDLKGGIGGLVGELKERLLRTFLVDILDNDKPLIGPNPYRYSRMDIDGAQELSKLIKETDSLTNSFRSDKPFSKKTFAAHSECDATANITGIEDLQAVSDPGQFTFFRIPETAGVSHASLVLKEPIFAMDASDGDEPLEKPNPQFDDMMQAMGAI